VWRSRFAFEPSVEGVLGAINLQSGACPGRCDWIVVFAWVCYHHSVHAWPWAYVPASVLLLGWFVRLLFASLAIDVSVDEYVLVQSLHVWLRFAG
jgi:hypothetical protein